MMFRESGMKCIRTVSAVYFPDYDRRWRLSHAKSVGLGRKMLAHAIPTCGFYSDHSSSTLANVILWRGPVCQLRTPSMSSDFVHLSFFCKKNHRSVKLFLERTHFVMQFFMFYRILFVEFWRLIKKILGL